MRSGAGGAGGRWRRRDTLGLALPGAVLAPSAATRLLSARPAAAQDIPLRVALPEGPTTLDPQRAATAVDRFLAGLLWEPLLRFGAGPEPQPGAAVSAEPDPDPDVGAERWLFTLRAGLRWPSGAPLEADDFRRGWLRLMSADLPAEPFAPFRIVRGAGAYRAGIVEAAGVGLAVPDPLRLRLLLDGPGAHLRHVAALPLAVPWPPTGDGGTPAGNGPYVLAGRRDDAWLLDPSPTHRDAPPGALHLLTRPGAVAGALSDLSAPTPPGDALADLVPVPEGLAPEVLADPRLAPLLLRQVPPATLWLNLNVEREPLDNQVVRRALAYAVDREAYCAAALGGAAIPAYSLIPPGCPGHDPAAGRQHRARPEVARTLLGAAGVDPRRLAELRLTVPATAAGRLAGTTLLDGLERHLGVRCGLTEVDRYAYVRVLEQRRFDLAFGGWESPYPDPEGWFWLVFGAGKAENRTGWESRALDALWRAADAETDPPARLAHYEAAQHILIEESPVVFLAHPLRLAVAHPRLEGLRADVMDSIPGAASLPGARLGSPKPEA